MQPKIIAFAGPIASGKDTIQNVLIKHLKISSPITLSFGHALKQEVELLISYTLKFYDKLDCNFYCFMQENFQTDISSIKEAVRLICIIHDNYNAKMLSTKYKTKEMRQLLQFWGTDVRRKADENYWVNIIKNQINYAVQNRYTIFITDCRFSNEMDLIKYSGGILIHITAPIDIRLKRIYQRDGFIPTVKELKHQSEIYFDNYSKYDLTINNIDNTLDQQIDKIAKFLQQKY